MLSDVKVPRNEVQTKRCYVCDFIQYSDRCMVAMICDILSQRRKIESNNLK